MLTRIDEQPARLRGFAAQRRWIMEYIKDNGPVDVCNEAFHDAFHERFGGKRALKLWGAQPVYKAQRTLRRMWEDHWLVRRRISLGEGAIGQSFPSWVWVYDLPPESL